VLNIGPTITRLSVEISQSLLHLLFSGMWHRIFRNVSSNVS